MPVSITCSNGHGHTVQEQDMGKTVPCPKCGDQITVAPRAGSSASLQFSLANFVPNLERLAGTAQARLLLWSGLACLGVLALSAFLPWATVFGYSVLGVRVGAGVCQLLFSLGALAFVVATILTNNEKFFHISLWSAGGWSALAALWRLIDLFNLGRFSGIAVYLGLLAAVAAAACFGTIAIRRIQR
jgi:hypothetical protein